MHRRSIVEGAAMWANRTIGPAQRLEVFTRRTIVQVDRTRQVLYHELLPILKTNRLSLRPT